MGRPRILVVDDEPGMLRSVERVLAPQHEVRAVRTAEQALEAARSLAPDLAILDIRMPDMDGFELMGRLKSVRPDLDVILMTGSVNEPDARLIRAIRERAFYFIHKPFERDVLLTLVARCLELRRLGEENREHVRRLESELEAGRAFQQSLLPKPSARVAGVRIGARYLPCAELCGDFYDYAATGDGRVTILVADVAGHGVSASMFAGVIKLAFHSAAESGYEPRAVLGRIAESLPRVGADRFVTTICVRLGGDSATLEYANAGHPAGLLLGGGGRRPIPLDATGPVIHPALPGLEWQARGVEWTRGQTLFLYTDGLTEAEGEGGPYGRERLEEDLIRGHRDGGDLQERVVRSLLAYRAGRPLEDDVTVLAATR